MFNEIFADIISFITSKRFYLPIIYILIGYVIYRIAKAIINSITSRRDKKRNHKKEDTVINLIKSVFKYLIIIVVVLLILEVYGINTTSILASLGIVGVVVGLAFQDTMKNMLAGVFIIFDNRYNVGDVVKINEFTGTVKSLGLQTTKLKAVTGEVFTISNSAIESVTNYTENDTLLVIELGVGYKTDISHLERVLKKLNAKIRKIENVKGDLELLGVDSFSSSEIVYKISVLCKPYTHFAVKREILKLVKIEFDKEEIEIPYTQIDLHLVEDKTQVKRQITKRK